MQLGNLQIANWPGGTWARWLRLSGITHSAKLDNEDLQIGGNVLRTGLAALVVEVALNEQLHAADERRAVPGFGGAEQLVGFPGHGQDAAVRWQVLLDRI